MRLCHHPRLRSSIFLVLLRPAFDPKGPKYPHIHISFYIGYTHISMYIYLERERVCRLSVGIVILVLGRYLIVGYFNLLGLLPCGWQMRDNYQVLR